VHAYSDFGLYIAGEWRPAARSGTKPVIDPATEDVIGVVCEGGGLGIRDYLEPKYIKARL
jgi:hypothetical protein